MSINVIQAVYASNNKGIDVTSIVAYDVSDGNDDITPSNGAFKVDPDPNSPKYFMVWYTVPSVNNGNAIGLACGEGVEIDMVPNPVPTGLYCTVTQPSVKPSAATAITVDRAVYGTPQNGFDVTAICQAIFNLGGQSGIYSVLVKNETFGGDPEYGSGKSFAMQYHVNGAGPFFIGASEGQLLNLPSAPSAVQELVATLAPTPAS